jgi:hypothetical protein
MKPLPMIPTPIVCMDTPNGNFLREEKNNLELKHWAMLDLNSPSITHISPNSLITLRTSPARPTDSISNPDNGP